MRRPFWARDKNFRVVKYKNSGQPAAADLLLLIGPDGYTDNDFDDLMQELE